MLTKNVIEARRDLAGYISPSASPAVNQIGSGEAANRSIFDRDQVQARRLRRQRREARRSNYGVGGWTVRMW